MQLRVWTSADGVTATNPFSLYSVEGPNHFDVQNGLCNTIQRLPLAEGGTLGAQFVYFHPGAKYLMFDVMYGPWANPPNFFVQRGDPCPSFQNIASLTSPPQCVLRTAYFLDYRWPDEPS